jgi:acyl-CoA synthetase (AMP-forming)/AMP-acid ligase II
VTVPPFLDKAKEAAQKSGVEDVYVFGSADGARPFSELLEAGDRPPAVTIDPANDLVALPYSSGTTGLPKGVMLTHRNLVANLRQCEGMKNFEGFADRDVVMAVLPYFHIYGMVVIMMFGLAGGGTIVSTPRFDMLEFLGLVQKYRATILPLVPPIVLGMVKHPAVAQYDLSSVRLVFSGAAPLGEDLARELSLKLGCPVVQGYGMTEASPVTHLSPTLNAPMKPGSAGRVVPNTEVKIVDVTTGTELPQGEEGELLIRGPQIMKGYLNQPGDTAACLDPEGWYHTGDVGYVDPEGYFFIVDRTKELIKYKGLQVAPAELEALLLTHPAVLDAAVVRKADAEAGEVPKAFVVLKPEDAKSGANTAETIMGWVAGRVAPHKRIRHLEFVDQIPKSASGKILRRVLMDRDRAR